MVLLGSQNIYRVVPYLRDYLSEDVVLRYKSTCGLVQDRGLADVVVFVPRLECCFALKYVQLVLFGPLPQSGLLWCLIVDSPYGLLVELVRFQL